MRSNRDASFHLGANAILGHAIDCGPPHRGIRCVDDLRVNACPDRFQHGFAGAFGCEVDRTGAVEIESDAGFVSGDKGKDHLADIASGEVVRLERIARYFNAGFHGSDSIIDDQTNRDSSQPHTDHLPDSYRRVGNTRAQP